MEHLQSFVAHLACERQLSAASCRLYLNGVKFLYREVLGWPALDLQIFLPKRPQRIPELLTRAFGGQRLPSARCGAEALHYHSCRDRHCPRCQGRARHQWAERERQHLLAVTYYHLVFTLPSALNPWAERHPEVLYRGLFAAAWGVLEAFGRDPFRCAPHAVPGSSTA